MLLCAAAAVLWVWNRGHVAVAAWVRPEYAVDVRHEDGVLGVTVAHDSLLHVYVPGGRLYGLSRNRWTFDPVNDRHTFTYNRRGFGLHWMKTVGPPPRGQWRTGGRRILIVYVPGWLPVLPLAVLPAVWVARRARSTRRRRTGLCPACGYDLRATPGRCPECGTMAPAPPAG